MSSRRGTKRRGGAVFSFSRGEFQAARNIKGQVIDVTDPTELLAYADEEADIADGVGPGSGLPSGPPPAKKSAEVEPSAMSQWNKFGLDSKLLAALEEMGFAGPTPIQSAAIPAAIRDRKDVIGAAETGSGKTLAFGLPLLHHLLAGTANSTLPEGKKPLALILTPTRELAVQVHTQLSRVAAHTNLRLVLVVGGLAPEKQVRVLKKRPHVIVATPGRLWQLVQDSTPLLERVGARVRYIAVDEADRMSEAGHFAELRSLFTWLHERAEIQQNLVFSATLTFGARLDEKLSGVLALTRLRGAPALLDLSPRLGTSDRLDEAQITSSAKDKDLYLVGLLHMYKGRVLVFANSIGTVKRLTSLLILLGHDILPLHSSLQQRQRLKNLDRFRERDDGVLLATDVAARGLDIAGVNHVIHYHPPQNAELYVHRSGRTARLDKKGVSVLLVCPDDTKLLAKLGRGALPRHPLDKGLLDSLAPRLALAQHIDVLRHKTLKAERQHSWLEKSAQAAELDVDQMPKNEGPTNAQILKEITRLQKALKVAIAEPVRRGTSLTRYPTQSGKLVLEKPTR